MKWRADLTRDDRYPTDLEWPRASARASEPQPHFLNFSHFTIFIIILFYKYFSFLNKIIIYLKTSKTRVNSTRFEAIYSNFRLIGALFITFF